MMFIKYAAFHLQQLGVKKQREREARNSQDREITQKTEKEYKVRKSRTVISVVSADTTLDLTSPCIFNTVVKLFLPCQRILVDGDEQSAEFSGHCSHGE
jgi:hypothetical protein